MPAQEAPVLDSGGKSIPRRVHCVSLRELSLRDGVKTVLAEVGILARVSGGTRVSLKPNLTAVTHMPGVTTSPNVIGAVVDILRERTPHIAIVESDGGYHSWKAEEAFRGHGLDAFVRSHGVELVNLTNEPRRAVPVRTRRGSIPVDVPERLLTGTDLFISLPVPKVHVMTGVSLAFKNQWGCLPDPMRLRLHSVFSDVILAVNRLFRPMVLGDGTTFLDITGPLTGTPVPMQLIIGATDPGSFDRYATELMGIPWQRVHHLVSAVHNGDMPKTLSHREMNTPPSTFKKRTFTLNRTPRNWIALAGFHSRFLSWLGYESWFGKEVLHRFIPTINPEDGSSQAGHGPPHT